MGGHRRGNSVATGPGRLSLSTLPVGGVIGQGTPRSHGVGAESIRRLVCARNPAHLPVDAKGTKPADDRMVPASPALCFNLLSCCSQLQILWGENSVSEDHLGLALQSLSYPIFDSASLPCYYYPCLQGGWGRKLVCKYIGRPEDLRSRGHVTPDPGESLSCLMKSTILNYHRR